MGIQDSLCFDWNTDIWKVIAFPPLGTWSNYTQNAIFWEGWLFLSTCGPDTLGTPPIHWIQLRCTHWTPDAIIHIIYWWSKWPIMAQNGPKWPNIAGEVAAPLALTSEVVAILCMRRFWLWDKVLNQDDRWWMTDGGWRMTGGLSQSTGGHRWPVLLGTIPSHDPPLS